MVGVVFGREEGWMVGFLTMGWKGCMGYGVRWVDWSLGQRLCSLLVPRYIEDRALNSSSRPSYYTYTTDAVGDGLINAEHCHFLSGEYLSPLLFHQRIVPFARRLMLDRIVCLQVCFVCETADFITTILVLIIVPSSEALVEPSALSGIPYLADSKTTQQHFITLM